jgi:hypothetical protein
LFFDAGAGLCFPDPLDGCDGGLRGLPPEPVLVVVVDFDVDVVEVVVVVVVVVVGPPEPHTSVTFNTVTPGGSSDASGTPGCTGTVNVSPPTTETCQSQLEAGATDGNDANPTTAATDISPTPVLRLLRSTVSRS